MGFALMPKNKQALEGQIDVTILSKEKKIKQLLEIPGKVKVSILLAVGYPKNELTPKRIRKPLDKILFFDRWGQSEPT